MRLIDWEPTLTMYEKLARAHTYGTDKNPHYTIENDKSVRRIS